LRRRSIRSLCDAPSVKDNAPAQKGRLTLTDSTRKPLPSTACVKSKLALFFLLACGGSAPAAETPKPHEETAAERRSKELDAILVEVDGEFLPARAWLKETLAAREPTATPDQLAPYSLECYGQRLSALYQELADTRSAPPVFLPKHRVLQEYLKPEFFNFLTT